MSAQLHSLAPQSAIAAADHPADAAEPEERSLEVNSTQCQREPMSAQLHSLAPQSATDRRADTDGPEEQSLEIDKPQCQGEPMSAQLHSLAPESAIAATDRPADTTGAGEKYFDGEPMPAQPHLLAPDSAIAPKSCSADAAAPGKESVMNQRRFETLPLCGVSQEQGIRLLRYCLAESRADMSYAATEKQTQNPQWGSSDE